MSFREALQRAAARVLLGVANMAQRAALRVGGAADNALGDGSDEEPAPPQDPITDETRELVVGRRPPSPTEQELAPPLEGSKAALVAAARKRGNIWN